MRSVSARWRDARIGRIGRIAASHLIGKLAVAGHVDCEFERSQTSSFTNHFSERNACNDERLIITALRACARALFMFVLVSPTCAQTSET